MIYAKHRDYRAYGVDLYRAGTRSSQLITTRLLSDSIRDLDNEVYLSVVSVWEVIIKHRLGKLPLPELAERYLPKQRERRMIASLALDESSVAQLGSLPSLHRDPFDRMLICQALQHELVIATVDGSIREYPVAVL